MLLLMIALASAAQAPTLDLELSCPGQYQDTETSTAVVGSDVATIETPLQRPGTASISLHGAGGELVYPHRARWTLTNVTADERHIKAQYVERTLMTVSTWRVELDRLTGDLRVASGRNVEFLGTCAPASDKQKF